MLSWIRTLMVMIGSACSFYLLTQFGLEFTILNALAVGGVWASAGLYSLLVRMEA